MKLVGYAFVDPDGPVRWGYLPLHDVTVVLGANDAGKSRMLERMAQRLDQRPDPVPTEAGDPGGAFFVELDEREKAALLEALLGLFHRIERPGGPPAFRALKPKDRMAELYRESVGDGWTEEHDAVLGLLPRSNLFAFEPAQSDGGEKAWRVHAAVAAPSAGDGTAEMLGRLFPRADASDPDFFVENATLMNGRPWQHVPDSPFSLVEIARTSAPLLPSPLAVPTSWASLLESAAEAFTLLLRQLRWHASEKPLMEELAGHDDPPDGFLDSLLDLVDGWRKSTATVTARRREWLFESEQGLTYEPDLEAVALHFRDAAMAALPTFVGERCSIGPPLPPLIEWSEERPLSFGLWSRAGAGFPVEDAADGHQIWLQLAFAEAIDAVRFAELRLRGGMARVAALARAAASTREDLAHHDAGREPEPSSEQLLDDRFVIDAFTAELEEKCSEALGELAGCLEMGDYVRHVRLPDPGQRDLRYTLSAAADVGETDVRASRPPLYLLDEPERHLHPRLQVPAARWLAATARDRRSQALVITHAVPFLNQRFGTGFVYVDRREVDHSALRPISPAQLTALSVEAAELGLNRGQLLAGVRVLLFVEGRADQLVLETLYAPLLAEAGVAVSPLTGAGRHAQIFDSDLLVRFTTAKLAILLDNLTAPEVDRLLTDPDELEEALRDRRSTERQAMASVLKHALMRKVHVEPLAHPGEDIIDVLPEEIITARYGKFPGHEKARAAHAAAPPNQRNRKQFYADAYGIPRELQTFALLAEDVRRAGVPVQELDGVIDRLELYSLDYES